MTLQVHLQPCHSTVTKTFHVPDDYEEYLKEYLASLPDAEKREYSFVLTTDKGTDLVNHPPHYNSHPSGIECIDIIRHFKCNIANVIKYVWRAGLKVPEGQDALKTEIQDCEKALWYLKDHIEELKKGLTK